MAENANVSNPVPLSAGAVGTTSLAAEAVTSAKLVKPTADPAKGAEKAVVVGAASPAQKVSAVVTGDGAKKEWAVTHNLNTNLIVVDAYSPETEPKRVAIEVITAKSANEAVVTLTAALGAGVAGYINIVG